MRLVVTCEHRFGRAPDGSILTNTVFDYSFWQRYLSEFESVRVVARIAKGPQADQKGKIVTGENVEFWPVPYYFGPQQFLLRLGRIRRSLWKAIGANDALLCRVPSPLADEVLPSFWKAHRPYGLEVIGDPEQALGPRTVHHPLRPLFRLRAARLLRRQCARAAAVAYVTRETLQKKYPCPRYSVGVSDVDQLDFRDAPRLFAANGTTICADSDLTGRAHRSEPCPRPRLLFVGSLAQMYKGPDVLLKAVKKLVSELNPEVVIVGDGKYRGDLQQMAADLNLSANVQFLGELPSGLAIRDQMDQATLLVLPSRTEGLPRVLIEAMARALPAIATRVGGNPELLSQDDLVDPEDYVGLAQKMKQVLANPQCLEEMSRRNLERAPEYRPEVLRQRRNAFYRFLRRVTDQWQNPSRYPFTITMEEAG